MNDFSKILVAWFQKNRRGLAWRKKRTPYSVWISEIMLQQTVIKTVIPFFEKWMKKYPDVFKLAKAKEAEVLKMWEGLGYYRRAENILKAARIIVEKYKGDLPEEFSELKKLPGIGEYTASAIMSIAFKKPYIVVDANVIRVGRRIFGLLKWDKKAEKNLKDRLRKILPEGNPGDFNEGIMELGQRICTIDRPRCEKCPLRAFCASFKKNLQTRIPEKRKTRITHKKTYLAVILHNKKILITKREQGLLKGLWGFPELGSGEEIEDFIKTEIGTGAFFQKEIKSRVHHYTRFRDELVPRVYRIEKPYNKRKKGRRWVGIGELAKLPFPSVYRKIFKDLGFY